MHFVLNSDVVPLEATLAVEGLVKDQFKGCHVSWEPGDDAWDRYIVRVAAKAEDEPVEPSGPEAFIFAEIEFNIARLLGDKSRAPGGTDETPHAATS